VAVIGVVVETPSRADLHEGDDRRGDFIAETQAAVDDGAVAVTERKTRAVPQLGIRIDLAADAECGKAAQPAGAALDRKPAVEAVHAGLDAGTADGVRILVVFALETVAAGNAYQRAAGKIEAQIG